MTYFFYKNTKLIFAQNLKTMSAFARKNVSRTLASTTHISKSSAKFCYFHIAIVELFNGNHALLQKNTFNQARILQQS